MNQIRALQKINETELENGILQPELSWHNEYRDQAYVFFGGLNKELTEADVLTVFSQYGVPVDIMLIRDQESGESKGFGYLKYEDQRSTVLAIDNLNGATVAGKIIKVDHAIYRPSEQHLDYRKTVSKVLENDRVAIAEKFRISEGRQDGPDEELADPMADFQRS